jgi:adenosine kinase
MMPAAEPHRTHSQRPSPVLVSGAVVIDLIGHYPGDFAEFEWATSPQRVAFDAMSSLTELVESYGGCAANITYNLTQLGISALLVSAVGSDFDISYRSHLERVGVDLSAVRVLAGKTSTPRSVTLTDRSGRQFSFWASNDVRPVDFPSILEQCNQREPELVIVAANLPSIMLDHLHVAASCRRRCLWAPGGDVVTLDKKSLQRAWATSNYVVLNHSEWLSVRRILGGSDPDWPQGLHAVVVTQGAGGSTILQKERQPVAIHAARPGAVLDPTGSGDAFVAGFSWGLMRGFDLPACARMGSALAVLNLGYLGTQCHDVTLAMLEELIRRDYGRSLQDFEDGRKASHGDEGRRL